MTSEPRDSLKEKLLDHLHESGVLDSFRAQLRAAVFRTLEGTPLDHHFNSAPFESVSHSSPGQLAIALLREFLECCGLQKTLSVFLPESHQASSPPADRLQLANTLRLEPGGAEPLLVTLLRRFLDAPRAEVAPSAPSDTRPPAPEASHPEPRSLTAGLCVTTQPRTAAARDPVRAPSDESELMDGDSFEDPADDELREEDDSPFAIAPRQKLSSLLAPPRTSHSQARQLPSLADSSTAQPAKPAARFDFSSLKAPESGQGPGSSRSLDSDGLVEGDEFSQAGGADDESDIIGSLGGPAPSHSPRTLLLGSAAGVSGISSTLPAVAANNTSAASSGSNVNMEEGEAWEPSNPQMSFSSLGQSASSDLLASPAAPTPASASASTSVSSDSSFSLSSFGARKSGLAPISNRPLPVSASPGGLTDDLSADELNTSDDIGTDRLRALQERLEGASQRRILPPRESPRDLVNLSASSAQTDDVSFEDLGDDDFDFQEPL